MPSAPAVTSRKARDAARYLLQLKKAQDSFADFVRLLYPGWVIPKFHDHLIGYLNDLERDALPVNNLLITMPPRHSKSTYSTVLFPSYFMARDPMRYIMSCSYNQELATGFGREIRSIVQHNATQQAFPDFKLSTESRAADAWRTLSGGAYHAMGIGGTTSGRPANLLVVDDPIKAREDAESMSQRNKTWSYYTSALTTRLQPQHNGLPSKQLIILTRWHPDDLAGRLKETDDWQEGLWEEISFKAIEERTEHRRVHVTELPPDHPLRLDPEHPDTPTTLARLRKSGKPENVTIKATTEVALWPERFPLETLKRRQRLNPHDFASLYQQEPYIKGGNLIRASWWRSYPSDLAPTHFQSMIISVDTAYKKSERTDYSVCVLAGMDQLGDIYIIDVIRRRIEFPELKQQLIHLNTYWRGRALRGIYIEDKASGMSLIQELKRESGMAIIPYKLGAHDKVARVNAILPIIQGGRVYLPESAPWLDDFIEEATSFPNGKHDDQVDALTMAIDVLSRTHLSPEMAALHVNPGDSLAAMVRAQHAADPLNAQNAHGLLSPSTSRGQDVRHSRGSAQADRNFGNSLARALKSSSWRGWGI